MKKRLIGFLIALTVILQITSPAFATSEDNVAYKAQRRVMDDYFELCDKMGTYADEDEIFEIFLAEHPSLSIIDSSTIYYDENGEIPVTRCQPSDFNMMKDSLVYDNDYGTYIYFGYWDWKYFDYLENYNPDDVVAYFSEDYTKLQHRPNVYAVYGYDQSGKRTAVYDPASNNMSGAISKGLDNKHGIAFWVNEILVRSGRIVVPTTYKSGANTRMMTSYCHSWTSSTLTGIGGDISLTGGGINVAWSTNVNSWPSPVTSPGAWIK